MPRALSLLAAGIIIIGLLAIIWTVSVWSVMVTP
jgi:hypothetical protein